MQVYSKLQIPEILENLSDRLATNDRTESVYQPEFLNSIIQNL